MKVIVTTPDTVEWVAKQTNSSGNFGVCQGIGIKEGDRFIAGVVYNDFNGICINAHMASDKSKRWMTRGFLWLIFYYPFEQLGVERVTIGYGEKNWEAGRLNRHLGFTKEAILERAHPDGRLIVCRMFKEECKWLRLGKRYEQKMAA